MSQDVNKHLERARRYLEKNKLRDAASEYEAVLEAMPSNMEAIQSLADIHVRLNDPARAAHFFGMQFDRLVESGDAAKATAIYTRFLKAHAQPPERLSRYAFLLQRQGRSSEAIECYTAAAERYHALGDASGEVNCLGKMAQLDPENPQRQIELSQLAEKVGNAEVASRAYLRAGQLKQAAGELDSALELFGNAYRLSPQDRTGALLYAEALLRRGEAASAAALLEPFSPEEADTAFHEVFGEALLRTGQLDRARQAIESYCRQKRSGFERLFELADAYFKAGDGAKGVAVLAQAKEWLLAVRQENALANQVDRLAGIYPESLPLAEFWARLYEELNREAKYFDALVRLFDLNLAAGKLDVACAALDRLVEIDAYDYRIHERIAKLEGKADPSFLRGINARAAKATSIGSGTGSMGGGPGNAGGAGTGATAEEEKSRRALEDFTVQAEIFLQYSLRGKAIERLERIAEMFPGEEERNERLRALYERADWWPKGSVPRPFGPLAPPPAPATVEHAAETHRDLAAIADITRLMYRQATPREVLGVAVREIGKYLSVRRCLAAIGRRGEPPQMAAEFAAPGMELAGDAAIAATVGLLANAEPDSLGGIELRASRGPQLRQLGLETALGVELIDKETQEHAGFLLVGDSGSRRWKPNESYFLQAVGDQVIISVNHTRLRSLVRTLAVEDERTGLLSRGAYLDCLLAESSRAKMQGTPLALVILQADRGPELLRQQGDAALENFMQQLARALETCVRQRDLAVKYTAWSIAFILPDTTIEQANALAEKLLQAGASVHPPWAQTAPSLSVVVAEAARRLADENEDRVTEWINRAEFGLEQARARGGNTIVSLAPPAA